MLQKVPKTEKKVWFTVGKGRKLANLYVILTTNLPSHLASLLYIHQ